MQTRRENTDATSTASRGLMAVDDDADITFTLKKELEQSGFLVDVFNDPIVALSNFKLTYTGNTPKNTFDTRENTFHMEILSCLSPRDYTFPNLSHISTNT